MRDIFNSHPVSVLKKEIAKTNIKGYSKMKKAELVNLMMKHKDRFTHIKMRSKEEKAPKKKIVTLLPQQRGLKEGDKEKYLKAKKNIKNLSMLDIVKLGLPKGLENSLQEIRDRQQKAKPPKKKIVKAVKKEEPKSRPRRFGKTKKEIEAESKEATSQNMLNAIGALEIGKIDPFGEDSDEAENRLSLGFFNYRNIKNDYKDDMLLNQLADKFKKLVVKRKNTPLMKKALELNKISTSTGARLSNTKGTVNKIYNEIIKT